MAIPIKDLKEKLCDIHINLCTFSPESFITFYNDH